MQHPTNIINLEPLQIWYFRNNSTKKVNLRSTGLNSLKQGIKFEPCEWKKVVRRGHHTKDSQSSH